MEFDFEILKRQIIKQYSSFKDSTTYSLGEVIAVFDCFISNHEKHCFSCHPRISNKNISDIICKMPCYDDLEFTVEDYFLMIPQYFETYFKNCDYSIVHFMSGDIRLIKFYEVCL